MATVLDNGFTPTQFRMLALLKDGKPHLRAELKDCIIDDMACLAMVSDHISNIRKKLPKDLHIDCILVGGKINYRLLRLITKNDPVEVVRRPRRHSSAE